MNAPQSSSVRRLAHLVVFTVIYFLLCQVGKSLSFTVLFASPVWPPAGFGLAALLISEELLWPGIVIALFSYLLTQGVSPSISLCLTLGALLETLCAVAILRRLWGPRRALEQVKDVLALVLIAAPLSALVGATIRVISLKLIGALPVTQVPYAGWSWWTGTTLSYLIITPLIITWASRRPKKISERLFSETATVGAISSIAGFFVFSETLPIRFSPYPVAYLVFPLVIWTAIRFKQTGASTTIFLVATIAVLSTFLGKGPFYTGNVQDDFLHLQAFMGIVSITGMTVATAISEQIKSKEQQQSLIESIDGIVWEADPRTFKFLFVSRQAERLLGYPIQRWLDEASFWKDHIHPDDRDFAVDFCVASTNKGQAHDFEYRMIAADGRAIWLRDIVSVEMENGVPKALRGVMIDISEKKRIEQKREEFLAISAHELRTPLTPLKLQMHVIKKQLSALGIPEQVKKLEQTASSATLQLDRLTRMVERLLDISQITIGHLNLVRQDCDLSELIRTVIDRHRIDLKSSHSELKLDLASETKGYWDPLRLEQVISNLVGNAIKYGLGTPIEIQSKVQGGKIWMSICDHGIGIAKEDQERIFKRFERAVPISRYGGIGLGLYITRLIVEAHGGSISVASDPQQGACFTVQLPLQ